jgi:23S rRNA (cytosine1962-C5)-methyltransferase
MPPTPYAFLTADSWPDYALIDSGNFHKLERYGPYVLSRPEPQAIWDPHLSPSEWKRADAVFTRASGSQEKGEWKRAGKMPERWSIDYARDGMALKLRLGLTSFKHVGLFPEQDPNWRFIHAQAKALAAKTGRAPKVLNLFAYTGAATLAARAAGAEVTHVDAVKQVNLWARENMEASGLTDVRWIVDDAVKFVQREVRRGNHYQGVVLDPPAYGRGPAGEKWQLEDELNQMLKLCQQLLDPAAHFFLINLYSLGFSAMILENLIGGIFPGDKTVRELGEIYLQDQGARRLPLGTFYRFAT